jgi:mono/diheme cytochrome c family protein
MMMKVVLLAALGFLAAGAAIAQDEGQALYNRKCATCHQQNGEGIPHFYPALSGDAFLLGAEDDDVIKLIFKGRDGMPAWAMFLKDDEVAKILTYARDSWGNAAPAITKDQVAALRKTMPGLSQATVGN